MPGGNPDGWPHVKDIFQSISAKADNGEPCCDWVGDGGAGHYVKMVHNGIEYGDMQLICEAYKLMKNGLNLSAKRMGAEFTAWNKTELDSYLIEITSHIFDVNDQDGTPLVDKILDVAGQKGTGKWTVINALDLGLPLTLISEAVFARCLSALKEERVEASKHLEGPTAYLARQSGRVYRKHPPSLICFQNDQLRPRLHAHASSCARVQMEAELWRHRPNVARWMHYPQSLFRKNQRGL